MAQDWITKASKIVIILLYSFVTQEILQAQTPRIATTAFGLQTSQINHLEIDRDGLTWIAGNGSIGTFNGQTFKYIPIEDESGNRKFHVAYSIREINDGQYWVCTNNGLYIYNDTDGSFTHHPLNRWDTERRGCAVKDIISISEKQYLVRTSGFGTYIINKENNSTDTIKSRVLNESFEIYNSTSAEVDCDGIVWISSLDNRIIRFETRTMHLYPADIDPEAKSAITSGNIIIKQTKDALLIGTKKGLLIYDKKKNLVRKLKNTGQEQPTDITTINDTKSGILIGTDAHGLWTVNLRNESVERIHKSEYIDLTHAKVHAVAEDKYGNLIIALYQKGILTIPYYNDIFRHHAITSNRGGTTTSCVSSIAQSSDGTFYIATDGSGIFQSKNNAIDDITTLNNGLNSLLVLSVAVDKHEQLWAATYGGGVQVMQGGKFITPQKLQPLSEMMAMSLYYDKENDYMYVSTNGHGIFKINTSTYEYEQIGTKHLTNLWVEAIYVDSKGTVWAGCAGHAVYFNEKTGVNGIIRCNNKDIDQAECFCEVDGKILIGSSDGLTVCDMTSKESFSIDLSKRYSKLTNIIRNGNHIWISTNNGIVCIDKKDLKNDNDAAIKKTFTSFGGLFIGEFHRTSSLYTQKGVIMMGGDNGIISFDPERILNRTDSIRQVAITDFRIGDKSVRFDPESNKNILDANITHAKKATIGHDENSFSLKFSVPEYTDPNRIKFDYKLDGYDDRWQHSHIMQNSVTYASLTAGTYKFIIKAYYEDIPEKYTTRSLEIVVEPAWYASTTAKLAYLLIAIIITYITNKLHRDKQKQKEELQRLEQHEREKTAHLNLFASLTHELRTPLTMIVSPLKQLISTETDENRQTLYKVMKRNSDRLLNTVMQISDITQIDNGQMQLKFARTNIAKYIEDIAKSFEVMASTKNVKFTILHSEDDIDLYIDRTHFEKIVVNLLSNAFKYTPDDGQIIMRIYRAKEDTAEIKIFNSGAHFSDEDLKHIYDMFYQGQNSGTIGSGIGLNLVYELVKLHKAKIRAYNVETSGVEFCLEYPMGRNHLKDNEIDINAPYETDENEAVKAIELQDAIEDMTEMAANKNNSTGTQASQTAKTIVIADDDKELLEFVSSQLKDNFTIHTAVDGNSAWKTILQTRPDLIVTDLKMPNGDGFKLCKMISENAETDNIPVIVLSSEPQESPEVMNADLNIDYYIQKPFNILILRNLIDRALTMRENIMQKIKRSEVGFDINIDQKNSKDGIFDLVNESIRKNISNEGYGVSAICEDIGVSRIHLNRRIKERYGMTTATYIKTYRVKLAAYMLINNKTSISECAYASGFTSPSYFTRCFCDTFGMTPKDFIANYAENPNDETLKKLLE